MGRIKVSALDCSATLSRHKSSALRKAMTKDKPAPAKAQTMFMGLSGETNMEILASPGPTSAKASMAIQPINAPPTRLPAITL
ncbi:hypothetical protein D3C76_1409210 [compost metagenome]